ncbi:MAG: N-acetylneuraminate synthase family protein [Candidatus Rokubacteria bacterium]|nr:N-acetylneuraminate synthase family protein [Candidatus Rokubacteria bacterium]
MKQTVTIGGRAIGPGHPVFVIAEAGVAHFGDLDAACRLADMAREAGADAVKFQVYSAERMISAISPDWRQRMGAKELRPDAVRALARHCRDTGIMFFASAHDEESVDLLESLDVPAYKIGSGEVSNTPYLRRVARKRRPIVLSTGMYTLDDVREAMATLAEAGAEEVVLLHCVTAYPTPPADANLRAMATLQEAFDVPVGYSDHTVGYTIPLAAVALGATAIEKHITFDKNRPGSQDSYVACDREDLIAMIRGVREVEAALGDGVKRPRPSELASRDWARKSVVAAREIPAGTLITEGLLLCKRPGTGIPPNRMAEVVGRRAARTIPADHLVQLEDLEPA